MIRGKAVWVVGGALVMMLGSACTGAGKSDGGSAGTQAIRVGTLAPNFTLPSAQAGEISLAGFRGDKPVLLYFSMGPG